MAQSSAISNALEMSLEHLTHYKIANPARRNTFGRRIFNTTFDFGQKPIQPDQQA